MTAMEINSYMPSLLSDGLTAKTMLVLLFPPVPNNSLHIFHILSMWPNTLTNEAVSLTEDEDVLKEMPYLVANVALVILVFWLGLPRRRNFNRYYYVDS
jgi:hypothetical protein